MTGDGVNDVLALKDADIGVAMGSGSSASRAVAQIVLLDNKFATLPYVVGEGRRVIGNIERVSNLFLTKTVYSVLLAVLVGLGGAGVEVVRHRPAAVPVPAHPRHHRRVVHHRHPSIHPVAGPQPRTRTPGFRAPGDDVGAAVGSRRRHRDVHLVSAGLRGPRVDADRADAGVDGGADHAAGQCGMGARGGGPAVRVVAGGARRACPGWRTSSSSRSRSRAKQFMLDPSNVAGDRDGARS